MSMTLTPSRGPMVLFAPDARLYAILSGHVTAGHWEDQGQPAYGRMRRLQNQRRPGERRDPYSVKLQLIGRGDASAKQQAPGVDGVDGPLRHRCARMRLLKSQTREPSVNQIIRIGMDTSKHIFQLHGVDAAEQPVLRKRLRRRQVVAFFAKLPPTVIGMEACGAAHYWARELRKLGHEVKLIAPQHVKPYVKRNKNDGRDAEGTCEAMGRPTMRFVPVKTAEQQAALMLAGLREQMVARRTQLSNTIRGYAAEFGVTAANGLDKIEPLLAQIAQDEDLPALARELFATEGREYARLH